MFKNLFVFICLISPFLSYYRPMKKDSKIGKHICNYYDTGSGITYVKSCGDGQYCKSSTYDSLGVCVNVDDRITPKTLGEDCTSDFECDNKLFCNKTSSSLSKCSLAYTCSSENTIYKTSTGSWTCDQNKYVKDLLYFQNNTYEPKFNIINGTSDSMSPPWTKLYGKISFNQSEPENNNGKVYKVNTIESAYLGTIEDGEYILDTEACKSGYALYFYPDGNLNDTYIGTTSSYKNKMYKRCVTVQSIDRENRNSCKIRYTIGGGEEHIYNVNQLSLDNRQTQTISSPYLYSSYLYSSGVLSDSLLCDEFLMTKLEMFKKYVEKMTDEKRTECESPENYDEPSTCKDNELTKWYYFYKNPEVYLTYKDDNEVSNYLIQDDYHYYQYSEFLNAKYFISLLILLLL